MKKLKFIFCCFLLFFGSQILQAQNPNWSINRANFEFQMRFTASIKIDGTILTNANDRVAVFVGNELRGVGTISFDADDNKYVSFFSAYSNTTGETLTFKIYNSVTDTVFNAIQTQEFVIDERIGGVFQSFVISNQILNDKAILTDFSFQGISEISKTTSGNTVNFILPINTDVTNLTPVFSFSNGAKAFINFVSQTSNSNSLDFTNSIVYQILSENEKTLTEYTINVSVATNTENPTVVLSSLSNTNVNTKQIAINIVFSDAIYNFDDADFQLDNAVTRNFTQINSSTFSVELTPILNGEFSITILENKAINVDDLGNFPSNTLTFNFDDERPIITQTQFFKNDNYFKITFNEPVSNIAVADFELTGSFSSDFMIDTISALSSSMYKVQLSGSSAQKGNLLIQLKNDANIVDFTGNKVLRQQKEVYFLDNSTNYFTANTGNWSVTNNWSLERTPLTKDHIIINADANTIADLTAVEITDLTNLGTTTLPRNNAITVNNTFKNSGNFIINADENKSGTLFIKTVNSEEITFRKTGLLAENWSLLSVPVQRQKVLEFAQNPANDIRINTTVSPIKYAVSYYDDSKVSALAKWVYFTENTDENNTFTIGEGYSISRKTDGNVSFTGNLTTENVNKSVLPNKWNAIANPYTTNYPINKDSRINFLQENALKLETPAAYVWDSIQQKYVAITNLSISDAVNIPAGKGFFIKTNTANNINFDKENRTKERAFNSSSKTTNTDAVVQLIAEKNGIAVKTSVIFSDKATLNFNPLEDIQNFDGASFDVTTKLVLAENTLNYTIQSISKSELGNSKVPIYITSENGEKITFSATKINLDSSILVYIEDKETNQFYDLNDSKSYSVIIENNTTNIGRFYLHTSSKVLSTTSEKLENIYIYISDNQLLNIKGLKGRKTELQLFDSTGKEVFTKTLKNKNTVDLSKLAEAFYVVRLNIDDIIISKKMIISKK